jgi:transcriptional regulator with XRE-family HTH domain
MTLLRKAREEAGLSQRALAIKAGVQSCRLCAWEYGERCTQSTAMRLASALGVDVRSIFPDFDNLRRW